MTDPREWSHPFFEAQLSYIFELGIITPEFLNEFVDTIVENAAKNSYLHTFLSMVNASVIKKVQENVKKEGWYILPDVLAYAVVLENLNLAMIQNHTFLEACYDVWSNDDQKNTLSGFDLIKTVSVEMGVAKILKLLGEKNMDPATWGKGISFNVFQAMVQDFKEKRLGESKLNF